MAVVTINPNNPKPFYMKVFGLVNKDSGAGFHRVMMPLLMMEGIKPYITNAVTPADFEKHQPGAIYYNRVISDDVILCARGAGCKVIVDIDDYWRLDVHHIAYKSYVKNNFESLQIKHLHLADVVTTTHEWLAEKIYPYNKNVVVLPNAIPRHKYFPVEKTISEKLRIFWQGSITHGLDIELLRNPVKRLNKNRHLMVMAGYTKHDVWDRMVAAYTNGLQMPGYLLPGCPPTEYYKKYSYADVCLAPLTGTLFNSLKSNLKILEAANMGLPVIASNVHPYTGIPGVCYVDKQTDWYKHIQELDNESERLHRGTTLQQYCAANYNYTIINSKRRECFI